jgi:hypothetical protein
MTMRIEEILEGTTLGPTQTVGHMQLIPLLGEDDAAFAPPSLEVGTCRYGAVMLKNDADRPTIVPPGAGWVVRQKAQDHAIGGGALLVPGQSRLIETALCIQQAQGGCIASAKHAMLILPAALRGKALAMRAVADFRKHWDDITALNRALGVPQAAGHLEYFLRAFQRELDLFVAQFEIVPGQLGAIVLCGGKLVGIERAPSAAYWDVVWEPLVRVSYGSLAIQVAKSGRALPSSTPLAVAEPTVAGIRQALDRAEAEEKEASDALVSAVRPMVLERASDEEALGSITLTTVTSPHLAGQVVTVRDAVRYASICVAA